MKKFLLLSLCFVSLSVQAQNKADYDALLERLEVIEVELAQTKAEAAAATKAAEPKKSRLTLGGYGEVTMSRHFYSDSWKRYSAPTFYADDESYGRFDIPHAVFFVGYNFGKGWTFGSEIEFEHGGLEVAVEIEEEGDYYTTFTTAGSGNSEYPNQSIALSTILEAAAGIADEVGSVKIADPIKSENVLDVESWFSHNSVTDFTNNIIGIKEAYYGKQYVDSANSSSTTSGSAASGSISAYVASGNSDLDSDIKDAIDTAIDAVASMEAPFRDNLTWDANNTAAADACAALLEALEAAQGAINDGFYTK